MPVRANKDIWILGDVFLTEAVAVLREIQNLNKDQLYLYSDYDPQIYYPKLLATQSFANLIRCQLFTALEEHNKLPSVIILILGNKNIDQMVMNPEQTRRVWNALFVELSRAIKTRKNDLPAKARSEFEPRVFVSNVFPRFKDHNERIDKGFEPFKTKRRRLNGILPQVASAYEFEVLPINGIIPDQSELFSTSTGFLNGKGIKEFWSNLSREFKLHDVRFEEKKKSKIIEDYFEQQREKRRIDLEMKKAERERLSLPRNNSSSRFDCGDTGGNWKVTRKDRSQSVPSRHGSKNSRVQNRNVRK